MSDSKNEISKKTPTSLVKKIGNYIQNFRKPEVFWQVQTEGILDVEKGTSTRIDIEYAGNLSDELKRDKPQALDEELAQLIDSNKEVFSKANGPVIEDKLKAFGERVKAMAEQFNFPIRQITFAQSGDVQKSSEPGCELQVTHQIRVTLMPTIKIEKSQFAEHVPEGWMVSHGFMPTEHNVDDKNWEKFVADSKGQKRIRE